MLDLKEGNMFRMTKSRASHQRFIAAKDEAGQTQAQEKRKRLNVVHVFTRCLICRFLLCLCLHAQPFSSMRAVYCSFGLGMRSLS